MGDPLVHPELETFLDICARKQVRVFFVSNGVLLRDKSVSLLLHPALRQVNFSLHSFQDNFGDADPTTYLERIFRYTEAAFESRPDLYINYRLWDLSHVSGTLTKQISFLERIEERFQVSLNRSPDVRVKKGQVVKNRLYLHFDTQFVWPDLSLPILGQSGHCYGLSSHFGILVDGTVVPCCLDKEGVIPLGNILHSPITEILHSPRAEAIIRGFRDGKLVEDLCRRCQYIERFA